MLVYVKCDKFEAALKGARVEPSDHIKASDHDIVFMRRLFMFPSIVGRRRWRIALPYLTKRWRSMNERNWI